MRLRIGRSITVILFHIEDLFEVSQYGHHIVFVWVPFRKEPMDIQLPRLATVVVVVVVEGLAT